MEDKSAAIEELKKLAVNGKISCTDARKLAQDLKVAPGQIGDLCNELKIKIMACELGCF